MQSHGNQTVKTAKEKTKGLNTAIFLFEALMGVVKTETENLERNAY